MKGIKPDEVEAATQKFARDFETITDKEFLRLFDQWFASLGEKPPQALPTTGQIWAVERRLAKQAEREQAPGRRVRPRPEFRDAMREFRVALPSIGKSVDQAGRDGKHEHKEPTFEDGVKVLDGREDCKACEKVDARRALIEQRIEELPEPVAAGATSCRCDGSGWRNEVGPYRPGEDDDRPRLPPWATSMDFDAEQRMTYPCSTCLPDTFAKWVAGELP